MVPFFAAGVDFELDGFEACDVGDFELRDLDVWDFEVRDFVAWAEDAADSPLSMSSSLIVGPDPSGNSNPCASKSCTSISGSSPSSLFSSPKIGVPGSGVVCFTASPSRFALEAVSGEYRQQQGPPYSVAQPRRRVNPHAGFVAGR